MWQYSPELNLWESVGRYERLFKPNPPKIIAQFSERVPIVKGRLSATASTATSYAWFIWCGTAKEVQNITTLRPQLPPNSSGSLRHEESMKSQTTMKNVWKLHILDPRVTPHKQTFLEKLKEIFK